MPNKYIREVLQNREDIPIWLKLINWVNLIPIIPYPIVLFFSVAFIDKPNLKLIGSLILLNSYPWVLIGTVLLSYNLYKKNKTLPAVLIPITVSSLIILFFLNTFHH